MLIWCPYPERIAPSQRFRFEQYLGQLRASGWSVTVEPFLEHKIMPVLFVPGHTMRKAWAVTCGFLRRIRALRSIRTYDYVLLHREAAPLGPPLLEAALFALHHRVVYDFDDAIYLPNVSRANRLTLIAKWPSKTAYIAKRAWKVAVSTPYLAAWAGQHNANTFVVPTTVDLDHHRPPDRGKRRPRIGWTGTNSTAKYLDLVRPALARLQSTHEFEFVVICDIDPGFPELRNYRFVRWTLESEIEDLCQIDIGLMPHTEGPWELGKAGFKAIQYSAVEAVPVVSNVGAGKSIVIDGRTGFVVPNDVDAWCQAIRRLLEDPELVEEMGKRGRELVREHWSMQSQLNGFLSLFSETGKKTPA
jgi:glycosyltransferase involved in cell wall biosynthesis